MSHLSLFLALFLLLCITQSNLSSSLSSSHHCLSHDTSNGISRFSELFPQWWSTKTHLFKRERTSPAVVVLLLNCVHTRIISSSSGSRPLRLLEEERLRSRNHSHTLEVSPPVYALLQFLGQSLSLTSLKLFTENLRFNLDIEDINARMETFMNELQNSDRLFDVIVDCSLESNPYLSVANYTAVMGSFFHRYLRNQGSYVVYGIKSTPLTLWDYRLHTKLRREQSQQLSMPSNSLVTLQTWMRLLFPTYYSNPMPTSKDELNGLIPPWNLIAGVHFVFPFVTIQKVKEEADQTATVGGDPQGSLEVEKERIHILEVQSQHDFIIHTCERKSVQIFNFRSLCSPSFLRRFHLRGGECTSSSPSARTLNQTFEIIILHQKISIYFNQMFRPHLKFGGKLLACTSPADKLRQFPVEMSFVSSLLEVLWRWSVFPTLTSGRAIEERLLTSLTVYRCGFQKHVGDEASIGKMPCVVFTKAHHHSLSDNSSSRKCHSGTAVVSEGNDNDDDSKDTRLVVKSVIGHLGHHHPHHESILTTPKWWPRWRSSGGSSAAEAVAEAAATALLLPPLSTVLTSSRRFCRKPGASASASDSPQLQDCLTRCSLSSSSSSSSSQPPSTLAAAAEDVESLRQESVTWSRQILCWECCACRFPRTEAIRMLQFYLRSHSLSSSAAAVGGTAESFSSTSMIPLSATTTATTNSAMVRIPPEKAKPGGESFCPIPKNPPATNTPTTTPKPYRILFVSYASGSPEFLCTQKLLIATAVSVAGVDEILAWNKSMIEKTAFYRDHPAIFARSRGDGFYVWKPYIIDQALRKARDGDFVVYVDSSRHWMKGFSYSLVPLTEWLLQPAVYAKFHGILPGLGLGQVRNGDLIFKKIAMGPPALLPLLNVTQTKPKIKFLGKPYVQATWSIWQKNQISVEFVRQWLHYCTQTEVMRKAHFADQDVANVLITKFGLETLTFHRGRGTYDNSRLAKDINEVLLKPLSEDPNRIDLTEGIFP